MFKDHFSGHAAGYARFRPSYPAALFRWLADQSPGRDCAWDAATGNGQAAVGLASHFESVIATDASAEQIRRAQLHPQVRYEIAPSEATPLEDHSVDLVLVAQALHWFDLPAFYREARRVARPGAILAALSYGLFRVTPEVDRIIDGFHDRQLASDWPPERAHVDNGYSDLIFPFEELRPPQFEMRERWGLGQLCGYLRTWSAVVRQARRTGRDPVGDIEPRLARAWSENGDARVVRWPITLRVGRIAD